MSQDSGLAPVVLAPPQLGDFCCIPVTGGFGTAIEVGQFLAGDRFQPYDHAEVYVGQPDKDGTNGYTYSAYPDNLTYSTGGKRPLPCLTWYTTRGRRRSRGPPRPRPRSW